MDNDRDLLLDALLERHLADRLDGQVGRAAAQFEQTIIAARPEPAGRRPRAFATRIVRVAATLGIAAMAGAVLLRANVQVPARHAGRPDVTAVAATVKNEEPTPPDNAVQVVWWQTVTNEGPVILEDKTPVRKLRRRQVEMVQWKDPDHQATIHMTVPTEDFVFVTLERY